MSLAPESMIAVVEIGASLMRGGGKGAVRQLYGLLLMLEERREKGLADGGCGAV
jgi:hypothetical protein